MEDNAFQSLMGSRLLCDPTLEMLELCGYQTASPRIGAEIVISALRLSCFHLPGNSNPLVQHSLSKTERPPGNSRQLRYSALPQLIVQLRGPVGKQTKPLPLQRERRRFESRQGLQLNSERETGDFRQGALRDYLEAN